MYQIQKTSMEDLEDIASIYVSAREFMAEHGNAEQWGTSYPSMELVKHDIEKGTLYAITKNGRICGVFYFAIEDDPTYEVIYNGTWHLNCRYGVIHRIAGNGSGGILRTAVEFASRKIRYLRIDTHGDNYVMQQALQKLGFQRCGIICLEDGSSRIAYDKII